MVLDKEIEISVLKNTKLTEKINIPELLEVLENPKDQPEKYHGVFRVITLKDGDKRIVWDKRDFAQIIDAKKMFDELLGKGLKPYKVGINGKPTAEIMNEFDQNAEEIIFLPRNMVAGG